VPRIALKIDVDTDRGTREGVPRLAALLERLGVRATFLFSLGPDHTGRAIRRVFRRGFVGKVRRTSVVQHYGVKTLLYGVLLPGPHIGKRNAALMRDIARTGFEVGVHTYDHVKWQDGAASADANWARRELVLAHRQFTDIFGAPPRVHGAAGWRINQHVPEIEHDLAFDYASDTRGTCPFRPVVNGKVCDVPQLPTTLPTLDELLGVAEHPLEAVISPEQRDHVFTLHAELEGGAYLATFEMLLKGWRESGFELSDLATYFNALNPAQMPLHELTTGSVEGRSGTLALQGRVVGAPPASFIRDAGSAVPGS
jgi:peptidoglycan/xylan/chitin deacetylase (PgdA/CDA1 family)